MKLYIFVYYIYAVGIFPHCLGVWNPIDHMQFIFLCILQISLWSSLFLQCYHFLSNYYLPVGGRTWKLMTDPVEPLKKTNILKYSTLQ